MKIGIMGGSFDPVHEGHIELAKQGKIAAALDKVIFVPVSIQPFKQDSKPASDENRVKMLEIATEKYENFEISLYEINKKGISYTVDTLYRMKELYNSAEIFFIVGVDAFVQIEKWKSAELILRNFSFIVGVRPGYDTNHLDAFVKKLKTLYGTNIIRIENKEIDISSTEIRECARKNSFEGIESKLSEKVKEYIINNEVYN